MKVVTKTLLLLFLYSHSVWSQSNNLNLSINKIFYNKGEAIHFSVTQSSPVCNGVSATAYLDLLDSKLQTLQQEIIKLNGLQTHQQFIPAEADSGYYLLRTYTKEQAALHPETIKYIVIGVGLVAESQVNKNLQTVLLFPESGQAMVNFTNRFAFFVQDHTGRPVQEKLLIRNKAAQLIAICNTDAGGWGAADIPLLQNDIVTIQTADGAVLKTINVTPAEVSNNGFSLHTAIEAGQVIVEMRKAEGELKNKIVLEVMHKNVLLYDARAAFRADTNIIATSFSAKGFENKLLRLLLKDEDGSIVSERQLLVPAVHTSEEWEQVLSEISCSSAFPAVVATNNMSPNTINDYLIPVKPSVQSQAQAEGFSLFFLNKEAAGQTLHYSISGSNSAVLQMGSAAADSTGRWEINGCTFKGDASVQFYLNNKQLNSYTKRVFPVIHSDSATALQKITSLLAAQPAPGNAGLNSYAANNAVNQKNESELETVTVVGKKSRIAELEDKYISNGMFRDMNATSINVEDDESAANYSLENYIPKRISGLIVRPFERHNIFLYRNGFLDYYLDETPIDYLAIKDIRLSEIGLIRFFKNPVRGGMPAERGGQLLKGGSGYAAGLQGSIVVYTKKFTGVKEPAGTAKGIHIAGYINE